MENDFISRKHLIDLAAKQNNLLDGGDVRNAPSVEATMFGIPMDEAARVLGIYATTREIPSSQSYVDGFYAGVKAQAEEFNKSIVNVLENYAENWDERSMTMRIEVKEAQPYEPD